ncbi:MAG: M28 family peptidase [Bacteroidetes bacterium]|nr:M28 family peptidase [Bacteroidota bacterium]MCH8523265.1 M28 family peptidase [Balneolales bacterium]
MYKLYLATFFVIVFNGCGNNTSDNISDRFHLENQGREVPTFSAQSAYDFIQAQVDFGPRNPNSAGHQQTRNYLIEVLREYAGRQYVFAQDFTAEGYDDKLLELTNIIAAFNPHATDRILLAAHWDTRPRAEEDYDPVRREEPILGADDGGSGVGILLELARIMAQNPPPIGVDIILFDGEDYGQTSDLHKYFLGARYWANNPPVPGYAPRFGILLDIVGAKGATFPKEGYSMRYARSLVDNVWRVAAELGYEDTFLDMPGGLVADDHYIVNEYAGIPMINIIHFTSDGRSVEFPSHWHTHMDNMDVIDIETLQIVGNVVTEIVYNRVAPQIQVNAN